MKLLSDNFMKSASQQTLDDAEAWLTTALYGGASEKQLRQLARAMEMLYERGVTDTLAKTQPQALQGELIPQEQSHA